MMNSQNEVEIDKILELLSAEVHVINLGLEMFAETFEQLGISSIHVDWRPPASGDADLSDLLSALM